MSSELAQRTGIVSAGSCAMYNPFLLYTNLGTPRMAEAPEFRDARTAFHLARHPGVYWQLSGMKMYCPWPHEPLHQLVADGVEAFGAERILWGSNFPAHDDTLPNILKETLHVLSVLDPSDRAMILAGTAEQIYPTLK